MRRAVYAGSFNPLTNGHWWVIQEAAKLFDELIVAIGDNPAKKSFFTVANRLELIAFCLNHSEIGIVEPVKVEYFSNRYLVQYAKKMQAGYIVRGIRSPADFEYEYTMRQVNRDLSPDIETVFLIPPREVAEVSSSLVRGLIGPEGWQGIVKRYVPPPVYEHILLEMSNNWD